MKAADTVMTEKNLDKLWDKYEKEDPYEEEDWGMLVARKQAKISFKAGKKEVVGQLELDYLINAINLSMQNMKHSKTRDKAIEQKEKLLKLKEWGIKK